MSASLANPRSDDSLHCATTTAMHRILLREKGLCHVLCSLCCIIPPCKASCDEDHLGVLMNTGRIIQLYSDMALGTSPQIRSVYYH